VPVHEVGTAIAFLEEEKYKEILYARVEEVLYHRWLASYNSPATRCLKVVNTFCFFVSLFMRVSSRF
jgi:hypothetical protein